MFHCLPLLFLFLSDPPSHSSILLRDGLQALQQGRLPEAAADLTQASTLDPQNPAVWISLAEVDLRLQQLKASAAAAANAERTGADNPVILHSLALYFSELGQPAKAGSFERKAAGLRGEPAAYDRAAKYFLAAGDEASALPLISAAAERSPELAFAWAKMFLQRQAFTTAAGLLEPAVKAHPDDPQLMLALGVARYGQRRFDDAISSFIQVIHIDPSIPQPYEFLGRILDQAGPRLTEITQLFRTYVTGNPGNAKANVLLAKALLAADAGDEQAEALLRRAITLDANDWESHYELGAVLERKHRYEEAAVELTRAEDLNDKEAAPHYHLARVYDRLGQPEKAAAERALHEQLTGTAPK